MDPSGCLASQGGDGAALPFLGTFVYASFAFLISTSLAAAYAKRSSRGATPPADVLAARQAVFGVAGTPTVVLLVKLCCALTLPQLVAFGALTATNAGRPATALADMAPLRLWHRHTLVAAAVGDAAPRPRSVLVVPAGRGVFVEPLAAAARGTAVGSAAGRLQVYACDAFGTPQCPDEATWLRHNVQCEFGLGTARAVDLYIRHVDFGARALQSHRHLPAPSGTVDVILAPFLWTTRSDVAAGESAAERRDRISALLQDARRVLAPAGRLIAIVPVFRRGAAVAALTAAGFDAVALPGWHWVSFLPSALIEARVAASSGPVGGAAAPAQDGDAAAAEASEAHEEEVDAVAERAAAAAVTAWTTRTAVRAAIFIAAFAAGCCVAAELVALLSRHWLAVSDAVTGAPPGLPYTARVAAVSLALQLNIPVGLILLLDGAWGAASARDAASAQARALQLAEVESRDGASEESPLLLAAAGAQGVTTTTATPPTHDVAAAARSLVLVVVGACLLTAVQWLPLFCVDLLWLVTSPPSSQDPLKTANQVIGAVVPFVLIQLAGSRAEAHGAAAAAAAAESGNAAVAAGAPRG